METKPVIDNEASEHIRHGWNDFRESYENFVENTTIQSSIMLYSLTNARKADKIIEVGVGWGLSSRMFVFQIMKSDAAYFASDISDEMVETFGKRLKTVFELGEIDSNTSKNDKVGLRYIDTNQSFNPDEEIKSLDGTSKKVFILRVNNEEL